MSVDVGGYRCRRGRQISGESHRPRHDIHAVDRDHVNRPRRAAGQRHRTCSRYGDGRPVGHNRAITGRINREPVQRGRAARVAIHKVLLREGREAPADLLEVFLR